MGMAMRPWCWLGVVAVASSCAPNGATLPAPIEPLRIAAASDLQAVLPALVAQFKRDHPLAVDMSFGASGQLAQQIRQGAPFDLFLSADQKFIEDLAKEGLVVRESVRPYARGSLMLVVHSDTAEAVRSLGDLQRAEVKHVAIANPEFAPYGRAARQALERANLWMSLEPKLVQAESVRAVLQYVRSGNAEAGLVGRAIVEKPRDYAVPVDASLYDPIIQGLGIVAASKRRDGAEALVRFLVSDQAAPTWAQFGFARVEQ
jgi:molybdate transport system substrate-binding protein